MTVGDLKNLSTEKVYKAIGHHRGDLFLKWRDSVDLSLSHERTKISLRSVDGIGSRTVEVLQSLVDGSYYSLPEEGPISQ
jgi:hypothetical protein